MEATVGQNETVASRTDSILVVSETTADKRYSMAESISASGGSGEEGSGSIGSAVSAGGSSARVPRKFITTWRHACDKTKDRTKDLFKRWRTLPEMGADNADEISEEIRLSDSATNHGWSVHVWATWVKRYPSDEEDNMFNGEDGSNKILNSLKYLTSVQKEKLEHFFSHLFDMDRDELVSIQDFESFCERLRRFADWTENSSEFVMLQQVKSGFIEHFIISQHNIDKEILSKKPILQVISLEDWLGIWGEMLNKAHSWYDFPVWLQYFPWILFQAINTTGSGVITHSELNMFYSSMLGLTAQNLETLHDDAYRAMTANAEQPLTYSIYRLSFANFLLGRFPNGPGHYIFGHVRKQSTSFPIDYSAMNTPPDQLEQYTPDKKTNRHSVMV